MAYYEVNVGHNYTQASCFKKEYCALGRIIIIIALDPISARFDVEMK